MINKKNLFTTSLLAFCIVLSGCASLTKDLTNMYSRHYAIDKNGRLFMVNLQVVEMPDKNDGKVRAMTIGGVTYPYSMIEEAPSGGEKTAVHNSIWKDAPEGWTSYVPGKYLVYPKQPDYTEPKPPAMPPRPEPPKPQKYPTITPEELEKIELAYAETVRDIEKRGQRLYIRNMAERNAFIQRWQGQPNTAQADAARSEKFDYFNSAVTPETNIVAMAKKEPNDFRKVRLIYDWVADIFAYDWDLIWLMDNVIGGNATYTLGTILELERGVCFEYAILFYFLMNEAGIETYLITDSSAVDKDGKRIGHAYNMVVINGTGYIIDTTWASGNQYVNGRIKQWEMMNDKKWFMPGVSQSWQLRGW